MRQFKTEKRLKKLEKAASYRQPGLTIVFENIHDPHNLSAMLRTCDAVGIQKVHIVYTVESFPKLSRVSSASANKWIDVEKHKSVEDCVAQLKREGFKIYASMLDEKAKDLYELDLTEPVAFIFGNEHRGVSPEFENTADETFYIPMRGMIQSLNVSVATGVSLFEAYRQRALKGMYDSSAYSDAELNALVDRWCQK